MPALSRRRICLALLLGAPLPCTAQPPTPMLATVWHSGLSPQGYWVSEKLDGMRAHWDGAQLWSRGGKRIESPPWFTAGWPAQPLDGELWTGRGRFEQVLATARDQQPSDEAWRALRFMVFDLPTHGGPFGERLATLQALIGAAGVPWLQAVEQTRVATAAELKKRLAQVVAQGGEGLMLHHEQAHYLAGRSTHLLKLKMHDDAEARVLAHLPGQGANASRLGALLVEMPASGGHGPRRFKLGSGLTEREREDPPPIGAMVTFRYRGLTGSGLPRFATFWRVRPEE